jgi:hypothetical protein
MSSAPAAAFKQAEHKQSPNLARNPIKTAVPTFTESHQHDPPKAPHVKTAPQLSQVLFEASRADVSVPVSLPLVRLLAIQFLFKFPFMRITPGE